MSTNNGIDKAIYELLLGITWIQSIPPSMTASPSPDAMCLIENMKDARKNLERALKILRDINTDDNSQNADEILTQLYDNEINWRISCFFDAGYKVELGDNVNGFVIGAECFDTLLEAAQWLAEQALEQKTCLTCGQRTYKYHMVTNEVIQSPGIPICNQCVEKHNSQIEKGD